MQLDRLTELIRSMQHDAQVFEGTDEDGDIRQHLHETDRSKIEADMKTCTPCDNRLAGLITFDPLCLKCLLTQALNDPD